ncbi:MAG: hypothetical protein AB1420_02240 [Bacillota bacterium]
MWTKAGLSKILLVKIKHRRKMGFTIPIAFTAIDELMESFEDWVWLFERLFHDGTKT